VTTTLGHGIPGGDPLSQPTHTDFLIPLSYVRTSYVTYCIFCTTFHALVRCTSLPIPFHFISTSPEVRVFLPFVALFALGIKDKWGGESFPKGRRSKSNGEEGFLSLSPSGEQISLPDMATASHWLQNWMVREPARGNGSLPAGLGLARPPVCRVGRPKPTADEARRRGRRDALRASQRQNLCFRLSRKGEGVKGTRSAL